MRYRIKEILKCTPYEKGQDCGVTEEQFLEKLYVMPYGENQIQINIEQINEIRAKNESLVLEAESNNSADRRTSLLDEQSLNLNQIKYLEKENKFITEARDKLTQFENQIRTGNKDCIYRITGSSGCGKSSYLGELFYELRKEGFQCLKYDLINSSRYFTFLGSTLENDGFTETFGKLCSLILQELDYTLRKDSAETEILYKNRLSKYNEFYREVVLDQNDEFYKIFHLINEYIIDNIDHNTFRRSVRQQLLEEIGLSDERNFIMNTKSHFHKVFRLLMLLHISKFFMDKMKNKTSDNGGIIIAFDSLEHYIRVYSKYDPVYDEDIIKIADVLQEAITSLSIFYKDLELDFSKILKIILVYRDTTTTHLSPKDDEDSELIYVNVNDFFSDREIINKRHEYFKCELDNKGHDVLNCIKLIMQDELSTSGLVSKISKMYNYNKRRMFEFLCKIVEENSEVADEYTKMCELVEVNKKGVLMQEIYKNASRNLIIGLLFKNIEKAGVFNRIYTCGGRNDIGLSYAREILTFIESQKRRDEYFDDNNYVSLRDVVKKILKQQVEPNDSQVAKLVYVLTYLNDSDKDRTQWCQLIVIKYIDGLFDKNDLHTYVQDCINNKVVSHDQFLIKITNAGRFLLEKMADFEYFSARYINDYTPLFFKSNLNINLQNGRFECINIICEVKNRAKKCIEAMMNRDDKYFESSGTLFYSNMYSNNILSPFGHLYIKFGKEHIHAHRIIDSHISYIDHYRNYILSLPENELSITDKETISISIIKILNDYVDKLVKLLEKKDSSGNYYYIGGRRSKEKAEVYYLNYRKALEEAFNQPLNHIVIRR